MLHTRSGFSQSVKVSVGISKLGLTDLIFVYPGVKINTAYYNCVLCYSSCCPVRDARSVTMIS